MQDEAGGGARKGVPAIFGKKYPCCPCCGQQTKNATCNIAGTATWVGHYEPCPEHQKATDT